MQRIKHIVSREKGESPAIHHNLPLGGRADNHKSESNHQRHQKSHEVYTQLHASHYCDFSSSPKVIKGKTSSSMATQFHLSSYDFVSFDLQIRQPQLYLTIIYDLSHGGPFHGGWLS
ncbi:hypothetical protein LR48_Vigan03g288900 [Vigna angularis]|uniref:Uncharacterized protein n=2 Tax=Phaseolus angularis TaxID=3914 RepID=A0A0L9UAE0_PHAAN|nr:hypothetical protein LR48_Vigan03g288900 [Vigna angularis]BAT86351.1 hypothetical protein VIGAN_04399100 [Vigna angularis var. angularis]